MFIAGRNAITIAVLLALTARLDSKPTAVALAAAQTALFYRSQRGACESILDGFVGIGSYFGRVESFIDRAMGASAWPVSAVAAAGSSGGVSPVPTPALAAVVASPHPYHASFSAPSEYEVRACVAVMTEFQVIAALVLVAFGTKPKSEEKEAEEDDDDESEDGGGGSGVRRRRRLALRGRRMSRLFRRWALFLVASAGVLRVAWAFLRSLGWERGIGSVDGGFGSVGVGTRAGGFSADSSIPMFSIGGKLKRMLGNGLFAA